MLKRDLESLLRIYAKECDPTEIRKACLITLKQAKGYLAGDPIAEDDRDAIRALLQRILTQRRLEERRRLQVQRPAWKPYEVAPPARRLLETIPKRRA